MAEKKTKLSKADQEAILKIDALRALGELRVSEVFSAYHAYHNEKGAESRKEVLTILLQHFSIILLVLFSTLIGHDEGLHNAIDETIILSMLVFTFLRVFLTGNIGRVQREIVLSHMGPELIVVKQLLNMYNFQTIPPEIAAELATARRMKNAPNN